MKDVKVINDYIFGITLTDRFRYGSPEYFSELIWTYKRQLFKPAVKIWINDTVLFQTKLSSLPLYSVFQKAAAHAVKTIDHTNYTNFASLQKAVPLLQVLFDWD